MKKKLIRALICTFILINSPLSILEMYSQTTAPTVAWRRIDWDYSNIAGEETYQGESGENWWYSGKPVYDAFNNFQGYVAVGYTNDQITFANESTYNANIHAPGNCEELTHYPPSGGDCADREINGRKKGVNRGQMGFLDTEGKLKWVYPIFQGEMIEVIQVSDGFIGVGETYGITTQRGLSQPYEVVGNEQIFDNDAVCVTAIPPNGVSNKHLAVVKVDFDGNEIWSAIYGAKDLDPNLYNMFWESRASGWDIIQKSGSANLIASGWAVNPSSGQTNIFLIEIDGATGNLIQKSMLTFPIQNHALITGAQWYGTEIVELGTSNNYVVAGRVEFPSGGDEFTNAFVLRVDNTLQINNGSWVSNPILFNDINPSPSHPDLANKRNGNITDILYDAPTQTLWVPVVQHCTTCYFGQPGNKGELKLYKIDAVTGTQIGTATNFGTVAAFDLRGGVTKTQDGNFAVVSSKKNFGQFNYYTEQMFIDVVDSSDLTSQTYCPTNLLNMQNDGFTFYDSDAFVAKVEPDGDIIWSTTFDADQNPNRRRRPFPGDIKRQECVFRIVETPDNGLTIFGNTSHNFDDYYIVKLFNECQINASFDAEGIGPLHEIGIFSDEEWSIAQGYPSSVKGIVHVYSGATLTIDGVTIEFADSRRIGYPTKIVVEAGGKLIIKNNAKLTSFTGCEKATWDGIEVWGNSLLSQFPENQQGVVDISNSTIENAGNGISTRAVTTNLYNVNTINWAQTGGGIIKADGASFVNCYRGVEFMAYTNFNSLGNPINDRSQIINCTFETNSAYGNAGEVNSPYTFISMWGTRNVKIEGNSFTNARNSLAPEMWGSGIHSIDAMYTVAPRCTTISLPCGGSIPNTFNNLYHGVYVTQGTSDAVVTVDGNIFNGNLYGVRVAGSHMGKIINNTFNIDDIGVPTHPTAFGIYADGAYGLRTQENVMNGVGPLGVNGRTIGTLCRNSDNVGMGLHDYKNEYNNLETGSQIEGFNQQSLIVDCNNYNGDNVFTTSGIFVADGEIWDMGTCGTQATDPEANIFTGTCNGSDRFQIFSNPSVISTVHTGFNWQYNSYPQSEVNFDNICEQNMDGIYCLGFPILDYSNVCQPLYTNSNSQNQLIAFTNLSAAEDKITLNNGMIDGGNTQGVLNYINGNHSNGEIRHYLLNLSPYLSDVVLITAIEKQLPYGHIRDVLIANSSLSYKVMEEVNNAGYPTGIYNQILAAQNGPGPMKDLLVSTHNADADKRIAISEITYSFLYDNDVAGAVQFLSGYDEIYTKCELVSIIGATDQKTAGKILDELELKAIELLGNPETSVEGQILADFCEFQRLVFEIQSQEGSYFSMTADQKEELDELMEENKLISSASAGILEFVDNLMVYGGALDYNFNQTHSMPYNGGLQGSTNNLDVRVYPNPASEGFSIEFVNLSDETGRATIVVYDLNGRKIQESVLGKGQDYVWINTESIENGVYLVSISVDGTFQAYKKVIVAK